MEKKHCVIISEYIHAGPGKGAFFTKAYTIFLSLFLVLSLISGCAASGTEPGTDAEVQPAVQADSTDELFISMTESVSKSLSFPLTEQQAAAVQKAGADKVTWTLHRTETCGNPADGNFIPIHGEEKMYPNEMETIDFASIRYNDREEMGQPFAMEYFETALDGSTLKLDFTTSPITTIEGNAGMPHESGGRFIDLCGKFSLTADLNGETLASMENVTIKPYATFHTMWELYDEIQRLSKEGDDDASTARPYVEYGVMGKSYLGYDMPYLIVARDSASVQKWLELSQKAEETGTAVIEELERNGDTDYQVPVMYTNIHTNEVAATDAIMEFARMMIEEPAIDYKKLTGFTEEGKAKSEQRRGS